MLCYCLSLFFFFSSRRRHTRCGRDWSSDVCSSDLLKVHLPYHESDHVLNIAYNVLCGGTRLEDIERLRHSTAYMNALGEIGRASCRERVEIWGGGGA